MTVLMAIGGNLQLNGSIMASFVQRSGGAEARLVIFPTASARQSGGTEYLNALQELGLKYPPIILPVRERMQAFDTNHLDPLKQASGIFFTGGDQLRLTTVLAGTPLLEGVRAAFRGGAVVAGTSAGAAMMGRMMISGGRSGSGARSGAAQFTEALGFIDNILFDQHFHQRNRIGRLIYAISIHPHLLGIGLDEDTATVIEDDHLTVIGNRTVTILDGREITESNVDQVSNGAWVSVSCLRLHQLTQGCQFDLNKRTATIYRKPLQPD